MASESAVVVSSTRRPVSQPGLRRTGGALICTVLALAGSLPARADDAPVPAEYRLNGYLPRPVADTSPSGGLSPAEFFFRLPSSFTFDSLAGVNPDAVGGPLDRARATLRYTWLSNSSWAMKVGLSTRLDPDTTWQRLMLAATDRPRVAPMPSMHLSGQGQLSDRWMLSLDAEGQRWDRGQSLDLDLRIDYHLSPGLALYGSYRLTDNIGENIEALGFPVSNTARFGVQLRF
jgi:hypothetical protein